VTVIAILVWVVQGSRETRECLLTGWDLCEFHMTQVTFAGSDSVYVARFLSAVVRQ
jgi:hypothetical protein